MIRGGHILQANWKLHSSFWHYTCVVSDAFRNCHFSWCKHSQFVQGILCTMSGNVFFVSLSFMCTSPCCNSHVGIGPCALHRCPEHVLRPYSLHGHREWWHSIWCSRPPWVMFHGMNVTFGVSCTWKGWGIYLACQRLGYLDSTKWSELAVSWSRWLSACEKQGGRKSSEAIYRPVCLSFQDTKERQRVFLSISTSKKGKQPAKFPVVICVKPWPNSRNSFFSVFRFFSLRQFTY